MSSPTQRSKARLEKAGWTVGITEKWNAHIRMRQDLWGFADLIAYQEGFLPLLIQTTSYSNVSKRVAKIRSIPEALGALRSGFGIEVHGWHKPKRLWECRVVVLTEKDLACPSSSSAPSSALPD